MRADDLDDVAGGDVPFCFHDIGGEHILRYIRLERNRWDLVRHADRMMLAGLFEQGNEPIDFNEIVEICLHNTILMDRLEGAGHLTRETAVDHGVLGYVARASGIDVDVRRDHPFAAYGTLQFKVPVLVKRTNMKVI